MLIGALAKRSGVSKDTIRHYNDLGLLIVRKRDAGTRTYWDYPEENISRIQMIKDGKSFGITLTEMKPLIEAYDNQEMSEQDIVTLLEEKVQLVRSKILNLKNMEMLLLRKLAYYTDNGAMPSTHEDIDCTKITSSKPDAAQ